MAVKKESDDALPKSKAPKTNSSKLKKEPKNKQGKLVTNKKENNTATCETPKTNNQNKKISSKTKSKTKLKNPVLIKLYYKRNKLKKLRKNYGANFSDDARYEKSLALAEKYAQKKADEHEAEVKRRGRKRNKQENKKKNLLNFLYFALNVLVIAIVLAVQLSSEPNPEDSITVISSANWWFILAALSMFVASILFDQIRCSILMHKATGLFRINLSYKTVAIGRYYDVITPLSVGGQPFQIFYTNKYGVKAGDGISVITAKYVFHQIVYFCVVTYILLRNLFTNTLLNSGVLGDTIQVGIVATLSWIGYAVTALLLFTIIFMALNKRAGSSVVAGILKFVSKIRIGKFKLIKDYNKSFISTMKTVNSWQVTTKKYFHSITVIAVNIVSALVCIFANYTVPFFIYCAFAGWQPQMWITIITVAVMVELSSAFNPIPMGIGTADLGFKVLYGAVFMLAGVSIAFVWAYIIWRILVYYIYIIQGLFVITYDYAYGNKKLAKYKDFWLQPFRERCRIKSEDILKKRIDK